MADFEVKFNQFNQRLDLRFDEATNRFDPGFQAVQQVTVGREVDNYEGDYDVTPTAKSQTLATKEKYMVDDVHIKAIPFFEVSNNSGGTTVYIGTLDDYPSKKAVLGKAKLGTMTL